MTDCRLTIADCRLPIDDSRARSGHSDRAYRQASKPPGKLLTASAKGFVRFVHWVTGG
jgi:hypothetical protein